MRYPQVLRQIYSQLFMVLDNRQNSARPLATSPVASHRPFLCASSMVEEIRMGSGTTSEVLARQQ